ncbi:aldo/keto reductase [Paenibacillus terrigena]|uniref:aldo/keto reductase n=1 Tax=Paenibacillus terrigena TaxID=369333 RepID=UPI0028D11CC6|nr:aldo/keto reductase [Paenibacillus terrigena]
MKHISFEGLRKNVSRLIMGSDFFEPENFEEVCRVLDSYVAIGGNTIDTAYHYGAGKSERAIGMWLEARKNRGEINLLLKGAHPNKDGPRVHKAAIREELLISLDRVQTERTELYALHRDDPNQQVGAILEALNEHLEEGRIGVIGASNWSSARLAEANQYAADHGLKGFSFSSPNLCLAKAMEPFWPGCVSTDEDMLAWHERSQLPILSWSALGRGFFSGRYTPEDRSNADLVRIFYNDANWERYRRAEELGVKRGVSTTQIALAYVLNQSFLTGAIIGPRNDAELKSCLAATELELTREEIRWLDLRTE